MKKGRAKSSMCEEEIAPTTKQQLENMGLFCYTTTEIREKEEEKASASEKILGYLCGFGGKKSQLLRAEQPELRSKSCLDAEHIRKKISSLTFISDVMNDD